MEINYEKSNVIETKTIHEGEWILFKTISVKTATKTIKDWEFVERNNKKSGKHGIDGVSVIAIYSSKASKKKKIVIEAVFRPPVNNYVMELPSGLVESDAGIDDALRELKEETGFVGKPLKTGADDLKFQGFYYDPWKSTESGRYILVEVDGDEEVNKNPKPSLEEEEDILVYLVDLDRNFLKTVEEIGQKYGHNIDANLHCFGLGISLFSWLENP